MAKLVSPPAGQAIIAIARRNLITGLVLPFSIFVDGQLVGTLRPFATGQYVVEPGWHRVSVRIGKRTLPVKPQVEFEIHANEVRTFRTKGRRVLLNWGLLSYSPDFEPGPAIKLKETQASTSNAGTLPNFGAGFQPGVPDASTIRNTRFRQVIRGYKTDEVDAFLRDIARQIEIGDQPSSLAEVTFSLARNGYDVEEVDSFLDSLGGSAEALL